MRRFLETRKIVVPVDFSDASKPVLEYAVDVARDRGATLTLLHVIGVPLAPFDPAYGVTADPKLLLTIQGEVEKRLGEMAERIVGVAAEPRVEVGAPSREIVRFARDSGADLIVIGTHGRTGLRHVFLGSVAETVVRQATCPVLVVRLAGFELESA